MPVSGQAVEQSIINTMCTKRKEENEKTLCFSVSKGFGYKGFFPFVMEKVETYFINNNHCKLFL